MLRLFLLSMSFTAVLLVFILGISFLSSSDDVEIIAAALVLVVSSGGLIVLGVSLFKHIVKHIRDSFK